MKTTCIIFLLGFALGGIVSSLVYEQKMQTMYEDVQKRVEKLERDTKIVEGWQRTARLKMLKKDK